MAQKTKKEILKFISELNIEDSISLMEDIEDSWNEENTNNTDITSLQAENETLKNEVSSLKEKYKQRFLEGTKKELETKIEENKTNLDDEGLREPKKFEDLFDEKGGLK